MNHKEHKGHKEFHQHDVSFGLFVTFVVLTAFGVRAAFVMHQ
jgi:hypothetical protein